MKWEFPGRQLESISDRGNKIEYSSTVGSGKEGAVSGLVWRECKAEVRDRGWGMRLEFSLGLAVHLYPAGGGKPLKGNDSCALKTWSAHSYNMGSVLYNLQSTYH